MTYYESADGMTITRERAIREIKEHGNIGDLPIFFNDLGDKSEYGAQKVLDWLGY